MVMPSVNRPALTTGAPTCALRGFQPPVSSRHRHCHRCCRAGVTATATASAPAPGPAPAPAPAATEREIRANFTTPDNPSSGGAFRPGGFTRPGFSRMYSGIRRLTRSGLPDVHCATLPHRRLQLDDRGPGHRIATHHSQFAALDGCEGAARHPMRFGPRGAATGEDTDGRRVGATAIWRGSR